MTLNLIYTNGAYFSTLAPPALYPLIDAVSRLTIYLLASFGFILAGAIGVQVYSPNKIDAHNPRRPLREALPRDLPGWTSRDLPLAETEETKNAVIEVLRFDDYFSRAYSSGSTVVTLYVAYWRPDKVPPRAVGVHTPDTCWVQNGWKRLSRAHLISLSTLGGRRLKPAEFGTYSLRGNTQQVYFWHLVGGKLYSYEQEGLHSLTAPLQDLATFGLNQRRDQLFVRLASNVEFEQVWHEPSFAELLEALSALGLELPPPGKN